jgi:hypothetical protein
VYSKADNRSAGEENPYLVWSPKIHCRIRHMPPLVRTLSQLSPVHPHTLLFQDPLKTILPAASRSPKWFFPWDFPTNLCISHFFYACHMFLPFYFPWFSCLNGKPCCSDSTVSEYGLVGWVSIADRCRAFFL